MRSRTKRPELIKLAEASPIKGDDFLTNLYLYQPATVLAKTLYLNEVYTQAMHLPGDIFEFGVWYGANLSLFASLRSVYEPYNRTRRIVGFDTFSGYPEPAAKDRASRHLKPRTYDVSKHYLAHLKGVMDAHEKERAFNGETGYALIKGLVEETAPKFLEDNPQCFVALAYLDLQTYEGTKAALSAIKPRLMPGSVIALDELTVQDYQGEAVAFREVFGQTGYTIRRSAFLPDRTIITVL